MSKPNSKSPRPHGLKALTVHVSRLGEALKARGLRLKDSELIEIAAQAFGLRDGNTLAAAQKAGGLTLPQPTVADRIRLASGERLIVLSAPAQDGLFAVSRDLLSGTATGRIAIAPGGQMLDLSAIPADEDFGWTPIASETQIEIPVLVDTVRHRHGQDIFVALRQADMDRQLAVYCRESWGDIDVSEDLDPNTMSDDEVATVYFNAQPDEGEEYLDSGVHTVRVTIPELQALVAKASSPAPTAPPTARPKPVADPLSAWRRAVAAGDTELGFDDWRSQQPAPPASADPDETRQFLVDPAEIAVLQAVTQRLLTDAALTPADGFPARGWGLIQQSLDGLSQRIAAAPYSGSTVLSLTVPEADALAEAMVAYREDLTDRRVTPPGDAASFRGSLDLLIERFVYDEPVIYLTNGCCENAHGDAALFAQLGLTAGSQDGDFYPLTPDEERWIFEDSLSHERGEILMAYTGLYRGQKYLMPVLTLYHDAEDDTTNEANANYIERIVIPRITPGVEALGGEVRFERDDEDDRHSLQILLPVSATQGCSSYLVWAQRVRTLVTTGTLTGVEYVDSVSGALIREGISAPDSDLGRHLSLLDAQGTRHGGRVIEIKRDENRTTALVRTEMRDGKPIDRRIALLADETDEARYLDIAQAKALRPGDVLISLVAGSGDVEAEDEEESVHDFVERTFEPGDWLTVDLVETNPAPQGLTIHVSANNGVSNVFDEADHGGRYPFLKPIA